MAFTATELITRAYYLANIVARGEETVEGDQLSDGLNMLNAFLAVKTASQRLIPYFTTENFTAVAGQETYFIENLISVQTLTYVIGSVRYPMTPATRDEYFGCLRANDINSLPFSYYVERAFGGSNISMYFAPDREYVFTIKGKFALNGVTKDQDLSLTIDAFYLDYMRYGLANYICQEYGKDFPPSQAAYLKRLESQIYDTSALDLTLKKRSTLQLRGGPDIYVIANISHGYIP